MQLRKEQARLWPDLQSVEVRPVTDRRSVSKPTYRDSFRGLEKSLDGSQS
jgi:hypothetical protein